MGIRVVGAALVVTAVIVIAAVLSRKRKGGEQFGQIREISAAPEEKKREARDTGRIFAQSEVPAEPKADEGRAEEEEAAMEERKRMIAARREMYQYLNQALRRMYALYQKDGWEELERLGEIPENLLFHYDKVTADLPQRQRELAQEFFSCIAFGERGGMNSGAVADREKLRAVFLQMMLPFYPLYYKEFRGLKYMAFLQQDTLELFRRLTGKRFRLGYKNRYETGVNAFEWKGGRYKIYDRKGMLLCDALFEDGKVKEGYAVVPGGESGDPGWKVLKKGVFKDGNFTEESVQYVYDHSIG